MTRRLLLSLACLALLVALGARPARPDVAETERRLKAVGIDAGLQAEIHEAIDRAVAYLGGRQRASGSFGADGARGLGRAALCAFALRHAGTPEARTHVDRARAFLFPEGRQTHRALLGDVYGAGLALLFLHADGPYTTAHNTRHVERLVRALADGQHEKSGWWAYKTLHHRPTGRESNTKVVNLSTSQFAGLGLWAGQPFFAPRPTPVWRRHLASLVDLCTPGGSWPYEPVKWNRGGAQRLGARAGPTGTLMALANLALAEAALGEGDPVMRKLRSERAAVRARALGALRRHAPWTLRGYGTGGWPFYALYSLEKACVFLGLERIGEIEWYREGASRLVAFQGDDGGWNRRAWTTGLPNASASSDLEGSALALLFLLRTSETLRPITPSSVDTPAPALTAPDTVAPPTVSEPVDPAPAGVPFSEARVILETLRRRAEDRRAVREELLAWLDAVGVAYATLVPDPGTEALFEGLADRWRKEAEALLLELLLLHRGRSGRMLLADVNRRAAELLGQTHARVAPRVRKIVEQLDARDADVEVLGACFDALADLGDATSAAWLAKAWLDTQQEEDRRARTERVLRALARFEALPGNVRLDALERILRHFEGVERAAGLVVWGGGVRSDEPLATYATWYYWERIRYDAALAVQALARDPVTGEVPRSQRGDPLRGMRAMRAWLREHDVPSRAPWHVR